MPINHDDEYHTEHPKPSDWYWMEPEEKKPYHKREKTNETN